MAGQYGNERVTTQNIEVVAVRPEENLLLVRGAVPGARGGVVLVRPAVKASEAWLRRRRCAVLTQSRGAGGRAGAPRRSSSAARCARHLLYEVVKMQRANRRAGTAATKTRGLVRGGGKKPWRQKGTGRARAGSNRSPMWVGGATIFGPQPRDYSYRLAGECAPRRPAGGAGAEAQGGQL